MARARLLDLAERYKAMLAGIRSERLRELIAYALVVANEMIDWAKVRRMYGFEEDRSLLIRIVSDDGTEEAGFILTPDNRVVPYTGVERVTVVVTVPETVFWLIVAGRLSVREAWLRDLIQVEGENPLRDAMILIPLAERIRELVAG